jgi:hypothetical protein
VRGVADLARRVGECVVAEAAAWEMRWLSPPASSEEGNPRTLLTTKQI